MTVNKQNNKNGSNNLTIIKYKKERMRVITLFSIALQCTLLIALCMHCNA